MGAPEPPPPVVDPELQNLTFDQLAQLVEEVSPDAFYERAAAFDTAMARLEHLRDDLGAQTRHLWEAWSGRIAEAFDDVVRQVSGRTGAVVQAMADPGYGAVLRRAGDALAQARQRMHYLRAQNRQNDIEAARQVVNDLGTAYRDLGAVLSPMPDTGTRVPAASPAPTAPGGVPAAGGPPTAGTPPAQAEYTGGGGTYGGAFTPLAALAHPGAQSRIGRAAPVSVPAVTSDGAQVPVVLGRTAAPAPASVPEPEPESRPSEQEAAVVLGRPVVGRKETARPAPAKGRVRTAGCTPESDRPDEAVSADEKVPTTSAPESGHSEAAARSAPTTEAVAEPITHAAPRTTAAPHGHVAASPVPNPQPSPNVQVASASPVVPAPGASGAAALPATAPSAPALPTAPAAQQAPIPAPAPGVHAAPAFPTAPAAPGHAPLPGSPAPGGFGGHEAAAGMQRGPGALPSSPAFQPVSGSLDATAAGTPPVGPGVPGSPRVTGDHATAGGYPAPVFRGGAEPGEQEREHEPASFLEAGQEAWTSGGDGAPVLGRPVAPPPDGETVPVEVADLEKLKDPEELRRVLGRLAHRDEG